MSGYNIKKDYKANLQNDYYSDVNEEDVIWQPDVYGYAIEFARNNGIKNIIDIGSGNGEKLEAFKDEFAITFVDFGSNLDVVKKLFKKSKKKHTFVEQNFEEKFPALPEKIIKDSVVICSDVIEHIRDFTYLLDALVRYSRMTNLLIVSTPERERTYGYDQDGEPLNRCHVREWNKDELKALFRESGMKFSIGLTRSNDYTNARATICVVSGTSLALPAANHYSKPGYADKILRLNGVDGKQFKKSNLLGIYNPLKNDYIANHFYYALEQGFSINATRLKLVNADMTEKYRRSGIENIGRLTVQYLDSMEIKGMSERKYPINFVFIYDHDVSSKKGDSDLITISLQQLENEYLPELLFGFNEEAMRKEATLLPNFANHNKQLAQLYNELSRLRQTSDTQQNKITELEHLLRKLHVNPVYYLTSVAKKTISKARRRGK